MCTKRTALQRLSTINLMNQNTIGIKVEIHKSGLLAKVKCNSFMYKMNQAL